MLYLSFAVVMAMSEEGRAGKAKAEFALRGFGQILTTGGQQSVREVVIATSVIFLSICLVDRCSDLENNHTNRGWFACVVAIPHLAHNLKVLLPCM